MDNLNVILFVDTTNITEDKIESNSWLGWPNRNGLNEEYTTNVKLGDTITWLGLSTTSPNDTVNITKIYYDSGSDLFGRSKLKNDHKNPEKVIGTIVNLPKKDKEETYTISFTVSNGNNGGKRKGKFRIDPKLKGNN